MATFKLYKVHLIQNFTAILLTSCFGLFLASPKTITASQHDGAQLGAPLGLKNLLLVPFYMQLGEVLASFIKIFPTPGPKSLVAQLPT